MARVSREIQFKLILVFGSAFFALAGLEFILALFFLMPPLGKLAPPPLLFRLRSFYALRHRSVIHFEKQCARYDRDLFYTLRPGHCLFKNTEFNTEINVNSIGTRGEEDTLKTFDTVVIGDSFAMGWGISQEETFAARLTANAKVKVLNTGVPSYATVREKQILDRLPNWPPKNLIVQYCTNDKYENVEFLRKGKIKISSEEDYEAARALQESRNRYYAGKYLDLLGGGETPFFFRLFGPREVALKKTAGGSGEDADAGPEEEVEAFLNALAYAGKQRVDGINIIVFSVANYHAPNTPEFLAGVEKKKRDPKWPGAIQSLKTLDLSSLLKKEHFFLYDDHLTPAGHALIATELQKLL